MKTKMIIFAFLFILCLQNTSKAQEYKVPVEDSKSGLLNLAGFTGDLTIEGYVGNDIILSSTNSEFKEPERAKGLKQVYSSGTDNTGMGLSVEKNGKQISVVCLLPFTKNGDYSIKIPENMSLKIQGQCKDNSDIFIKKLKNEIEIQTYHSINLQEVSGPLVLSTISGNINITFAGITTDKPFSVNSVSGEIDITLPAKIAADIEMESVTGSIYSDFDFSDSNKDMKHIGGNRLTHKLNGGGIKFSFVTVSGKIYLRKKI